MSGNDPRSPPHRGLPVRIEKRLSDEARFLKTWFDNPLTTGAVIPSGRALARMMARYADPTIPGPVVELGPGTGPVTEALIQHGIAEERLVLIEFDTEFCRLLRERFPRARIVQGDAYTIAATLRGVVDMPAACFVSSLPLLARPERQRLALLAEAFALMHPKGSFIQFTYGMSSPIPREAGGFVSDASSAVWLNIPPARVWIYRPDGATVGLKPPQPMRDLVIEIRSRGREARQELKSRTARLGERIRLRAGKLKRNPAFGSALAMLRRIGDGENPNIARRRHRPGRGHHH